MIGQTLKSLRGVRQITEKPQSSSWRLPATGKTVQQHRNAGGEGDTRAGDGKGSTRTHSYTRALSPPRNLILTEQVTAEHATPLGPQRSTPLGSGMKPP